MAVMNLNHLTGHDLQSAATTPTAIPSAYMAFGHRFAGGRGIGADMPASCHES
jgi:hypothetical protein